MAIPAIVYGIAALGAFLSSCNKKAEEKKTQSQEPIPNDWISIPAGTFKRGDENGYFDEKPVKDIYVSAFKLQKHGVTNRECASYLKANQGKPFEAVVQCGEEPAITISKPTRQEFIHLFYDIKNRCDAAKSFMISSVKSYPYEPVHGDTFNGDNQPVVGVDWFGAQAYCESINGRLPTEAERERAARGVSTQDKYATSDPNTFEKEGKKLAHYVWGGIIEPHTFEQKGEWGSTAVVCSYPVNSFGFCDLSGNTWEWGADWYQPNAYESAETRDPKGPVVDGSFKVLRGGSWFNDDPVYLRAAARFQQSPENLFSFFGFRCAQDS